jgi:hypothetical protein
MNTLTHIKPQNTELLKVLQGYQRPEPKKKPEYRYPSSREEFNALDAIFNQEFRKELNPHEANSCRMLAKIFTLGVAHHDVYDMACQRIAIGEEQLCKHLVGWRHYPDPLKNRWRKGAAKYLKVRAEEAENLKAFYERQAHHLNGFDDKTADELLDMEDTEIDVQLTTDLGNYIAPAPSEANYSMTCKQVAVHIGQQSGGAIYLAPTEVWQALTERKYTPSEKGFYVKIK